MELRVITNGPREEGSITIDTTGSPLLVNGDTVIDDSDLAKLDILESLLEERDWNITNRLFLDDLGEICMSTRDSYSSSIPEIKGETMKINLSEDTNIEISGRLDRDFLRALSFNPSDYGVFLRTTLKFLEVQEDRPGSVITMEEDYTNVINFNRFTQELGYNSLFYHMLAIVTLGYVVNGERINKDILVKPYIKETKINTNYYTPDNLVLAETRDGVLRVFPLSSSVTECIILSCTLIYEKD